MRRSLFVLALLTGGALAASVVPARAACQSAADQSTYEVLALREQMVLLATKCGRDQDYNKNFVMRFQPVLQANDRAVLAYFRKLYGGGGQGRKDVFTTELVNVMSQQANGQAGQYCARAGLIINEMNALTAQDQLAQYAAAKDLAPAGTTMCPRGR